MQSLSSWRQRRGWTQARLAQALAITPAYMSQLFSGRRVPSMALLRRMASVTGLSVATLARDVHSPDPAEPAS